MAALSTLSFRETKQGKYDVPEWLVILAVGSLVIAVLCALMISIDILKGHRQHMWIMNVVWPITALYSGPIGLWAYFKVGRLSTRQKMQEAQNRDTTPPAQSKPFWQSVGLAASHCGSGCTLGDLLSEGLLLPLLSFTLFGHRIFAGWVIDFAAAFKNSVPE